MDLLSTLGQYVSPDALGRLGGQIGATPEQTQAGVAAALPALLGGLARNTRTPDGAASLDNALGKHHDGGLLDNLGGLLGGGAQGGGGGLGGMLGGAGGLMGVLGGLMGGGASKATDGAGILGHVFGGRQGAVEDGVSRASGLSRQQSMQLMMMLAPLVLGALGKMKQKRGLDAQGVASVLDDEQQQMAQQAQASPQAPARAGGLAGMFDRDGDGNIAEEVAGIGAALGGAYLLHRMGRR